MGGTVFLETMEGATAEALAEAMAAPTVPVTVGMIGMETLTDTDARRLASVERSEARHLLTCEAWESVARRPSLPFCMEWSPQALGGPWQRRQSVHGEAFHVP